MTVLRSLLFNVFFFGWLIVMLLMMLVCLPFEPAYMQRVVRIWSRGLQRGTKAIVGLDYELRGEENIPDGPAIYACKHQSAWETGVFLVIFENIVYVMKKELLSIPFWGWYARKYGAVAVDRAGGVGALKGMVRDCHAFLDAGRSVILFPEGTRTAPGERRPYFPGIAAVYARSLAPMVPVALNSGLFWGRRKFIKRPGTITIEFLPPMPDGLDKRAFLSQLQERIEDASERLRAEAEARPTGAPPPIA